MQRLGDAGEPTKFRELLGCAARSQLLVIATARNIFLLSGGKEMKGARKKSYLCGSLGMGLVIFW